MNDQIEIKDLDQLTEVDGADQIAVQRASDGKLYRANKDEVKGDAATVDVHSTETGAAGTDAIVTNEGTTSAAKFKFVIPRGDKGEKGNEGAQVDSVEFSGNDMIFTLDDGSIVTLTNAKLDLKGDTGETGETGASIISAAFVGNDLVFTKDDSSTVTLANAKIVLKGDTGEVGPAGDEVELRKTETHIEWKLSKETDWNELIALSEITGEDGTNGQEVSLQKTSTHIQWKLGDGAWQDLIALSELKGEKGEAGDTGITWESTWDIATPYSARDVVYYDGSSWIATQDNVGKTPSAISDYWDLLALKGEDGEGQVDAVISPLTDGSPTTAAQVNAIINTIAAKGGGTIKFLVGQYGFNDDINLKSGVAIIPETPGGVLFSFAGTNKGVKIHGTLIYDTGTVSITQGTNTVTGHGTLFEANVTAGQKIFLYDKYWTIASVDSDTQLTLSTSYTAQTLTEEPYVIANTIEGVTVGLFAIFGSSGAGISIQYAANIFPDMILIGNDIGVKFNKATIVNVTVFLGDSNRVHLYGDTNKTSIREGAMENSTEKGLHLTNGISNHFEDIGIWNSGQEGIYVENAKESIISGVFTYFSGADGIKMVNTKALKLANSFSKYNTGNGLTIDSNCEDNIVVGCDLGENTGDDIGDSGTRTVISGCSPIAINSFEQTANKKTAFQETPTDTAYPTEKLVKDSLDAKLAITSKASSSEINTGTEDGKYTTPKGLAEQTVLEKTANKKTNLTDNSDDYYPTQKAVKTAVDTKQDNLTTTTVEITVADWDGGTTVTKTVSGMKPTSLVWVSPAVASMEKYLEFNVMATAQDTDEITFTADETPDEAININIIYEL